MYLVILSASVICIEFIAEFVISVNVSIVYDFKNKMGTHYFCCIHLKYLVFLLVECSA